MRARFCGLPSPEHSLTSDTLRSFPQVSCSMDRGVGLGQVPYNELLQFMATATFGAYFAKIPDLVSFAPKQRTREAVLKAIASAMSLFHRLRKKKKRARSTKCTPPPCCC